jgi:hypothetical protein
MFGWEFTPSPEPSYKVFSRRWFAPYTTSLFSMFDVKTSAVGSPLSAAKEDQNSKSKIQN